MDTFNQLTKVNNKLSKSSIGIGGNNNVQILYISSISKAEKRLKKLQRDFQHTYQKYIEARSNSWYNYSFYIKTIRSEYRCQTANCVIHYKYLLEQLQNDLDKLNKEEAKQRGIERHEHCKQVSMLHSYKSLAEEKRILQQIGEKNRQHLENNDLGQEKIQGATTPKWMRSWEVEFKYYQNKIPKRSSSKAVYDLLRRIKDTEKLRDKAIVSNPTSDQHSLKISSIKMEIKLLEKVIKKLEEERGSETRIDNGEEKMKHLEKKCEFICRQMDEENKYIVELK